MKIQWPQILLGFVLGALVTVPFMAKADLLTDTAKAVVNSSNTTHEPHVMAAIDSLHHAQEHIQEAPKLHYHGHLGLANDAIGRALDELQKADDSAAGRIN